MISIGIDPGKSGAIALIRDGGRVFMQRLSDTEQDVAGFLRLYEGSDERMFCLLERMQPMPSAERGVVGGFKIGQSYGFLRGVLVSLGIAFEEIVAAKWQRAMGIQVIKDETGTVKKNRHKQRAGQLFPGERIVHATADALLIAEYCRRLMIERGLGG